MIQLHPTSVPDLFHLIEVDGDEVNVTTARYLTPVAAKAHRVLERLNVLHGEAARQEAAGIDPAFTDRVIEKAARS